MLNRQWVVAQHPTNELQASHFGYKEVEIIPPKNGEVLLKTHYLNLAPVMRMYMMKDGDGRSPEKLLNIGDVIRGRGVAEVIESRHPDYSLGDFVQGQIGWQTLKVSTMSEAEKFIKMPPRGVPAYYGLSALGMTGYSAYCGFVSRGQPRPGDAVLVSGAAGGVGSLVVQIAKAIGCSPIIGIAGGAEKGDLVKSLGADNVIDYKSEDVAARLSDLLPNGIDLYFDNVGGEILDATLANLAKNARIVLCGAISEYTRDTPFCLKNLGRLRRANANIHGFFVYNHMTEFSQAETDMADWIKSGQLRALVDIKDGFEQMPDALMGLYNGTNKGKCLVRVNPGEDIIY